MILRASLFLLPVLAAAQTPPPEVDQALRERANQFLQYQVDGNFRKSFDLVAEDTKDWYFAATKSKLISFKIESLEYSDNFTKAIVKGVSKRNVSALGQTFTLDIPMKDSWKLEDGKWMWYRNVVEGTMETPFGTIPSPKGDTPAGAEPSRPAGLPTDTSPKAVAAAGERLATATDAFSVSKTSIKFVEGVAASDEIVFHNGAPGLVRLLVNKVVEMPSVAVETLDTMVKPNQDVHVKVTYTPGESDIKRTNVSVTVEPFGRRFMIPVTVSPARAPK